MHSSCDVALPLDATAQSPEKSIFRITIGYFALETHLVYRVPSTGYQIGWSRSNKMEPFSHAVRCFDPPL